LKFVYINQLKNKPMKTAKIFMSVTLLAILFSFTPERKTLTTPCPLITLVSPPATLKVGTPKACQNTLTVSTTQCAAFTFHFSWPTGNTATFSTAAGSAVLMFNLPAMPSGTTISLTIDDCCGGSSAVYTFTATTSC
jgi:hypothetical protein